MSTLVDRLSSFLPGSLGPERPLVPVVRLSGAIGMSVGFRPGLSLATLASTLERAFSYPRAKAVALVINSPGGSPVQSHLIYSRIRALADEKKLPVLAFTEDAAASGGYMIACAADEIFADPSSVVGSIGVVSAGFGFHELIERYGIERRLYTTGESKAILDPFKPERQEDVDRLRELQTRIYDAFKGLVMKSRAGKVREEDGAELFSGAFWAGEDALRLGLVDGIGDLRSVLRERFGDKVRPRLMQAQRPGMLAQLLRRAPSGSDGFSSGLIDPKEAIAALEERALWARIGM